MYVAWSEKQPGGVYSDSKVSQRWNSAMCAHDFTGRFNGNGFGDLIGEVNSSDLFQCAVAHLHEEMSQTGDEYYGTLAHSIGARALKWRRYSLFDGMPAELCYLMPNVQLARRKRYGEMILKISDVYLDCGVGIMYYSRSLAQRTWAYGWGTHVSGTSAS